MPRTPYSTNVPGSVHFERPNGSDPTDTANIAVSISETFAGTSRRKPKGFIPPTSYSFLYRRATNAFGSCKNINPSSLSAGQIYTGVVGGVGGRFSSASHFDLTMPESKSDANVANQALIRARNKIKATDVNLGVAFAERSATARLVGSTAVNIAKSYRQLRRGEIRNAMDTLGISSSRREPRGGNAPRKWLELQYGWKPLLSDVYGSVHALSKRRGSDWLVTAKGRSKSSGEIVREFSSFGAGRVTASYEHSAMCRIDALPRNDAIMSLASLGITNPLLIGWELLPFSFVVDWFLPIGGWLESLDALLGYDTIGYSNSVFTRLRWHDVGRTIPGAPGFTITNSYEGLKDIVKLDRSVSLNVPFPHFPGIKDPRSLEHMANGLSLLATVFGRR